MMKTQKVRQNNLIAFLSWSLLTALFAAAYWMASQTQTLGHYRKWLGGAGLACLSIAAFNLSMLLIGYYIVRNKRPVVEISMLSKPLKLVTAAIVLFIVFYCLGKLSAFGTFFSLFGGLLLGWSLQTPLSGLVAWFLICIKRSIRPGDRIQFPDLKLTGDIEDVGAMYLTLNQVGGSITSEEAVGRRVLVPNAMLFNYVVINYTVAQEAAYILDEVVVRITYNSNWEKAEEILLDAARVVTADIIEATGTQPYIRSSLYDYGIYLRLRFKTRVKDRAEIAYEIEKKICEMIQKTPSVDIAIPYVYSYRTAMVETVKDNGEELSERVQQIQLSRIRNDPYIGDPNDIRQLSENIAENGR